MIPQGKVRVDHVKRALGLETAPLTWLAIKVSPISGYSQSSLTLVKQEVVHFRTDNCPDQWSSYDKSEKIDFCNEYREGSQYRHVLDQPTADTALNPWCSWYLLQSASKIICHPIQMKEASKSPRAQSFPCNGKFFRGLRVSCSG